MSTRLEGFADSQSVHLATWKASTERRVELWRDAAGRCFVRKVHLGAKGAARASREARALSTLRAAGVRTPQVWNVAIGSDQSVVDMEWLEGFAPLDHLLPAFATDRRAAAAGLRYLSRALHLLHRTLDAGVWEPDLHAGNVLIGPDGEVALIDLHRARRLPSMALGALRAGVERRFLRFFLPFMNPRTLAISLGLDAAAAEVLWKRAQHSRRSLLRGKDRRARGSHRSFEKIEESAGAWLCERGLEESLRSHSIRIASEPSDAVQIYKARARAEVKAVDEHHLIKVYLPPLLGASRRAKQAWRASLAIQHSRIRLCAARGMWLGGDRALLLCQRGPERHLAQWLYRERPSPTDQIRVARELARSIAVLHRDGLRLRDLRAENFLIDSDLHAHRIDFDGIARRKRTALALNRSACDLARLRASFPPPAPLSLMAVEHFVRCYATERGLSPEHLRRWRRIAAQRVEELWKLWRQRGFLFDADGIHEPR